MVSKDPRKPVIAILIALCVLVEAYAATLSIEEDDVILFLELDEILHHHGRISTERSNENSLRLLSLNLNRFFDDVDNGNNEKVVPTRHFTRRIDSTVTALAERFGLPDIVVLQEVENRNVLQHLSEEIWYRYRTSYRTVLLPGPDVSGINLGYLVQSDF